MSWRLLWSISSRHHPHQHQHHCFQKLHFNQATAEWSWCQSIYPRLRSMRINWRMCRRKSRYVTSFSIIVEPIENIFLGNGVSVWCVHRGPFQPGNIIIFITTTVIVTLSSQTVKLEEMEKKAGNAEGDVSSLRWIHLPIAHCQLPIAHCPLLIWHLDPLLPSVLTFTFKVVVFSS